MPKIILIDGNSLAYRAFYALPDSMRTTTGIITNAIYGFTTMLLKILDEKPEYAAIAFDRPEPTFRHKEYKEYKATREKAPPTLYAQMPYVKEVAATLGLTVLELAGYEADDIIGTLAKKAEKEGLAVEIFSGDMDPAQLVNSKIKLRTTKKGISDIIPYGEKEIEERYGIKPSQLIDYKALRGDPSDNIPGVPKIGEKTAALLLQQFGSLDNIINNVDKIDKASVKESIKNNLPLAALSKKLATIDTDVPLKIDLEKCQYAQIDWNKVLPLFEKFEFDSLVKKHSKGVTSYQNEAIVERKREKIAQFDFKAVLTGQDLDAMVADLEKARAFAFDLETTGLDPFSAEIVGISFSCNSKSAYYFPLRHPDAKKNPNELLAKLFPLLSSSQLKIGHNLKYDLAVLKAKGINFCGPYFDSMVAAYLLDPISGKYGLKTLAKQFLGREMIKLAELVDENDKQANFAAVPIDLAKDYACSDAEATFALYEIFRLALKAQKLERLAYEIEMPLVEVLVAMELNGISIDKELLAKMSIEIDQKLKYLETQIYAIAGEVFNLNSPKQLANILFTKLLLPIIKRTKTGPSTDGEVLEELVGKKFEIAEKLMEYRQLAKLKNTYVDVLPTLIHPQTGRIHTSFNHTIAATGRLSSSNPNLQNIPLELRSAFIAEKKDGVLIAADYSQIELRILAHMSQDQQLIKAFAEGKDIHVATAAEVMGVAEDKVTKEMRSAAKAVNFGIIYGMSDFGLAKQLKIKKPEAAAYIEKYFTRHSGVKAFLEKTIKEAKEHGYVTTLLGRKRPIPDINSPNFSLRSFAERTATNTPIQGTAADIIKLAMVNIIKHFLLNPCDLRLILQVHDELVFECPKSEAEKAAILIKETMESALKLSVPLVVAVKFGRNWEEAK